MATIISGAETTQQTVALSGDLVITQTGIVSTSGDAITSSGYFTTVLVAGEVYGGSDGIYMDDVNGTGFGAHNIQIATGEVVAGLAGSAIQLEGSTNRIENSGNVFSPFGLVDAAIDLNGNGNFVSNAGVISGRRGIDIDAATASNDGSQISNSGSILTEDQSLRLNGDAVDIFNSGIIDSAFDFAIEMRSNHTLTLTNIGTISSRATDPAIQSHDADDVIINMGLIDGGIDLRAGTNTFRNTGSVVGDFNSDGGADLVTNAGLIDGDVSLGGGADFYRGFGGTVTGTIDGGAGDDTFLVDQIGVLINGGADFDKVLARADFASAGGIERIVLQGADNINGTGDAEANIILGNIGDNELSGMTGNDTLLAGDGDDLLLGGDDADILRGGKGNDVLAGGSGRDELFGGLGEDVFLFDAITDSGIGGANRDRIKDFQTGVDIIDLSELSDPAFSFEGTGGLSGTGPSISYSVLAGGHSLVSIDVDGDGAQDMQVLVLDTGALTAGDFLL